MGFAVEFVVILGGMVVDAAPVLLLLLVVIVTLAIVIGRTEGWTLADSVYYGFVTATTVGYGDFRPRRLSSKALAIVIAFVGLIQIGIVIALAVQAIAETYDHQAAEGSSETSRAPAKARDPAQTAAARSHAVRDDGR